MTASQEVVEIVIHNLVFWTVYMWVATLPYKLLQNQIDKE